MKIRANLWTGGRHEITRKVVMEDGTSGTEFLPTNHETFLQFRCMRKDDMEEVISYAVRRCNREEFR